MVQPQHSKFITQAAREILKPLGLFQKGRSRTWLDDHGWWIIVVEFQPSSWSKGSYLNVGAMWLWHVKDYESFDEGYRVEGFVSADENPTAFEGEAKRLAERAAIEVKRIRSRFNTLTKVAEHLGRSEGFWNDYHPAVAHGLLGQSDVARSRFAKMIASDDDRAWVREAVALASSLSQLLKIRFFSVWSG